MLALTSPNPSATISILESFKDIDTLKDTSGELVGITNRQNGLIIDLAAIVIELAKIVNELAVTGEQSQVSNTLMIEGHIQNLIRSLANGIELPVPP